MVSTPSTYTYSSMYLLCIFFLYRYILLYRVYVCLHFHYKIVEYKAIGKSDLMYLIYIYQVPTYLEEICWNNETSIFCHYNMYYIPGYRVVIYSNDIIAITFVPILLQIILIQIFRMSWSFFSWFINFHIILAWWTIKSFWNWLDTALFVHDLILKLAFEVSPRLMMMESIYHI